MKEIKTLDDIDLTDEMVALLKHFERRRLESNLAVPIMGLTISRLIVDRKDLERFVTALRDTHAKIPLDDP